MSAPNQSIRQGLPRVAGGDPWPPAELFAAVADTALLADPVADHAAEQPVPEQVALSQVPASAEPEPAAVHEAPAQAEVAEEAAAPLPGTRTFRQGLPRVAGGSAWPPASVAAASSVPEAAPRAVSAPVSEPVSEPVPEPVIAASATPVDSASAAPEPVVASGDAPVVRRGLPRTVGAEAWPPASFIATPALLVAAPAVKAAVAPAEAEPAAEPVATKTAATATVEKPAPVEKPVEKPAEQPAPATKAPVASATAAAPVRTRMGTPQPSAPAAANTASKAKPATAPSAQVAPAAAKTKKEPVKHGPLTTKQWVLAGILGAFCALGIATAVVLVARGIAGIDAVESFMKRYPGEYHLPDSAPIGFPAWLAWNHFFNVFLMVLIIRSGLLVRHQKKPPAYWSSKRSPKVSINLWLHQGLDLLWVINGLVFLVLLFATGHWMRIVPTSWEVFPNAISAALQYLTLDWPTENGWVNYNSLQQLAYFTTVFIAAPLAAITGVRLSAFWPKNMPALTKKYPIEVARALHFPTMLYFVLFILVHVILVFSTGALRNLNHMYAAQGSTDPAQYADNWAGLLFFALSLLVIAGAWFACRPMILASIARLFGKVSAR
ncbi:cytochrome b/b6 domain-containing protein [Glutamicibacter sp. MCAF14]|uniref:cytochrome b/b6 domain-containing protein n=1 Tax=Glutamicibacter sp. MCAF14 TaxID=3233043 RepID=UPI003F933C6C